uniref:Protein furry homolog-like (inferred by orthology to a human protein) n=1 Tax=Strongyloides venezuelensis TaxID=75913 RepID=A0A0K0G2Z9_STRVS
MANCQLNIDIFRRKSESCGQKIIGSNDTVIAAELPWGGVKIIPSMVIEYTENPGKFVGQTLMLEIFSSFEKKIQRILDDDHLEKLLSKSFKRSDDPHFDNLLKSLGSVAEKALPSILRCLISWYDAKVMEFDEETIDWKNKSGKKFLATTYFFFIVLIEVLPQLHFYPHECNGIVEAICCIAFKRAEYHDITIFGQNGNNHHIVSETAAEVIGVLSHSHFDMIKEKFLVKLIELKKESPITRLTVEKITALILSMKYFRIKINQVNDLEAGFAFLNEIANDYLETDIKQKELKHAYAGLLVEIIVPVAAAITKEVNVPFVISFVDKLYGPTYDLVNKKQHKYAVFPLLTCLLCISQQKFFLANWTQFLNITLVNLKNKEVRATRIALESLYRLLYVYIIKINGEGNAITRTRLEQICNSIFPKGNRHVIPKDAPLNIFVKIIHFISQQKLDFAFKDIIMELMGCNKHSRNQVLYPERMNIALRSFMVVADAVETKEGPPSLPKSLPPIASGTIAKNKKTYITHPLTEDLAKSIGLEAYLSSCRKAFDNILRLLDKEVGRPFMLHIAQIGRKEPEEMLGGECRPKLDLFRTAMAAIPRLLPETMQHTDLIDILSRMTIHMDSDLRESAGQTLQTLMTECPDWREDIIHVYLKFCIEYVHDSTHKLIEMVTRNIFQFLYTWKSLLSNTDTNTLDGKKRNGVVVTLKPPKRPDLNISSGQKKPKNTGALNDSIAVALHSVEGYALTLLCQFKILNRKMAYTLLKEVKGILSLLPPGSHDKSVLEVLDEVTPYVYSKYIEHTTINEKQTWFPDFFTALDKLATLEPDNCLINSDKGNEYFKWDPWATALSGYCEYRFIPSQCPTATAHAWPTLYQRLTTITPFIDPANPQNEHRASLLRSSKSKATIPSIAGEQLNQHHYLSLWQKYLVMCCALTQPPDCTATPLSRSFSPSVSNEADFVKFLQTSIRLSKISNVTCVNLFQKIINILRWDNMTDMRDSVVLGLGSTNPICFEILLEELHKVGIFREVLERKLESNVRRRKRRDLLRIQILRVIEISIFRGVLSHSNLFDSQNGQLSNVIIDFLDSVHHNLLIDPDRDAGILNSLSIHFAKTITLLISEVPSDNRKNLIPNDKRRSMYYFFYNWCSSIIDPSDRRKVNDVGIHVAYKSLYALCAILCCGQVLEAPRVLAESSHLFSLLESLMSSQNTTVQSICEETLSLMIHLNDQSSVLLDWCIRMCFTKNDQTSGRCFRALVNVFSKREYPCDFILLLVLCQTFSNDSDSSVRDSAVYLLQILKQQFLDESFLSTSLNNSKLSECSEDDHQKISYPPKDCGVKQMTISRQLSSSYAQLTMPIISEVFHRFERATYSKRASMLNFLLPWIENIELVDSNCEITPYTPSTGTSNQKRGWGSIEATQLLMNNLIYITGIFSNDHPNDIGSIWRVLAKSYPNNLNIIIHYLFMMIVISSETMIPIAKYIVNCLISEMEKETTYLLISQLKIINDHFGIDLVRSDISPYYRWNNCKDENVEKNKDEEKNESSEVLGNLDDSNVGDTKTQDNTIDSKDKSKSPNTTPKQIPMPAYGGHYCRLDTLFPPITHPITPYSRSNLALILISDVITYCKNENTSTSNSWDEWIATILHTCFMGLDSPRTYVCRYSKKTIMNICLMYCKFNEDISKCSTILAQNMFASNRDDILDYFISSYNVTNNHHSNANDSADSQFIEKSLDSSGIDQKSVPSSYVNVRKFKEYKEMLFNNNAIFNSNSNLLQGIIHILSYKIDKALWMYDDKILTSWTSECNLQIGCFARHLVEYLLPSIPTLAVRWTEYAMHLGLNTSVRFTYSRSLQLAAALCQSPSKWIPSVLSKLVEVSGEQYEEYQCYGSHLLNYILSTTTYLNLTFAPFFETDKLTSLNSPTSIGHTRSISFTPVLMKTVYRISTSSLTPKKVTSIQNNRHSMFMESEMKFNDLPEKDSIKASSRASISSHSEGNIQRSKSATNLSLIGNTPDETELEALCQILLIAISLLESSIENEILLGIQLIDKVFDFSGSEVNDVIEQCSKTIKQLEWNGFNGIVYILTKGCIYYNIYETTFNVLIKCIDYLDSYLINSSDKENAISLIMAAVIPLCLHFFEKPTSVCINATVKLSNFCESLIPQCTNDDPEYNIEDHPLHNLAMMLRQYADCSFTRDRQQWAKCVTSYMLEAFKPNITQLVTFISEMLDKASHPLPQHLLHIIYLLITQGDMKDASPVALNGQVVRIVYKYIQGNYSKDASKVLKCIVDQWNMISIGQLKDDEFINNSHRLRFDLEFTKSSDDDNNEESGVNEKEQITKKSTNLYSTISYVDALKPLSTTNINKVREKLISLLTASGLQARLPKSNSVVISQSSNDLFNQTPDNQQQNSKNSNTLQSNSNGGTGTNVNPSNQSLQPTNSVYSSSDRISHQDELDALSGSSLVATGNCVHQPSSINSDTYPRVFKEFDFLEAEHDSISESTDSCFNWLSTMRPRSISNFDVNDEEGLADIDDNDDFTLTNNGDADDEDEFCSASPPSLKIIKRKRLDTKSSGRISQSSKDSDSIHDKTLNNVDSLKDSLFHNRRISIGSEGNVIDSDKTPIQSTHNSEDSSGEISNVEELEDDEIIYTNQNIKEELDELTNASSSKSQKSNRPPSSICDNISTTATTQINGDDSLYLRLNGSSNIRGPRSETSTSNYNYSLITSIKPPLYLECNHHISGQVEQIWLNCVIDVSSDQDGELTSHAVMLFSQLFRECCVKLSGLIRDASHFLTMASSSSFTSSHNISSHFSHALDVLLKIADCPILFITPQYLRGSDIFQKQKFSLYELKEHYETFVERQEQCIRALNAVKSSLKLLLINGPSFEGSLSQISQDTALICSQELELCRSLHKLFFQLLLLSEKLHEMISLVSSSENSQQYDLSPAVLSLHRDLLKTVADFSPTDLRLSKHSLTNNIQSPSVNNIITERLSDSLVLQLTNKNYKNALMMLRQLREQNGSEFGCCDHMDVEVLLIHFCRSQMLRTWAIVGSLESLIINCNQLKDTNMQLSGLVQQLTNELHSLRSSRVSSIGGALSSVSSNIRCSSSSKKTTSK